MLTKFLKYLQVEKNYSAQTLQAYGDDLRQFFSFCDIDPEVESFPKITPRTIRAWLSHLLEKGVKPRSVNRKLSSLRGFYKFLLRLQVVTENPLLKIVPPKSGKRLPSFLSTNEANNLLDEDLFIDGFFGLRDKIVLSLFYFTGIRVSEMANLQSRNIDLNGATIKVLGKGSKERIIPIHPELVQFLKAYQEERNSLYTSTVTNFIVSNSGGKPYPRMLYRIVNKYISLVTPLEKRSPHVLRHTFATHLLNHGADINAIKELLGHANLSATQVYTHTSVQKLKSAYQKAHPRA